MWWISYFVDNSNIICDVRSTNISNVIESQPQILEVLLILKMPWMKLAVAVLALPASTGSREAGIFLRSCGAAPLFLPLWTLGFTGASTLHSPK